VFSSVKYQDFKQDLQELMKNYLQNSQISLNSFRIWFTNSSVNSSFEELKNQIKNKGFSNETPVFSINGENLEFYSQRSLKELNIREESLLLIEMRNSKEFWFLKAIDNRKTPTKRTYASFSGISDKSEENYDTANVRLISSLISQFLINF